MTPADELLARLDSHGLTIDEMTALIRRLIAERDEARARRRWNIEEVDGVLLVCRGDHDRADGCDLERFVPEAALATAREEGRREMAEEAARIAEMKTQGDDDWPEVYVWPDGPDIAAAIRQAAQKEGGGHGA